MKDVHRAAAIGFDKAADAYERARPGYPDEAVDWLVEQLRAGDGVVVDLGAGTGKMTRALVARGLDVVAVEPVGGMRAKLVEALPSVRALDGTAEVMPLADGEAAAVVVAQAFHWFKHTEALEEIHRVLRRAGRLGIVWNVRDERVDWVAQITEIIRPYEGEGGVEIPRFRHGKWRRALAETDLFKHVAEETMEYAEPMTVERLVDRVDSTSFIAALPVEERAQVDEQVRALARDHPDLTGKDAFDFPYVTEIYVYEAV
ncbi:MAG TPA: class I SAM-dependent methyltransferase [Actinomycetota bacterium]|nr:class I SAM-dependent methyltransferase [Actinomycetota bacterium]